MVNISAIIGKGLIINGNLSSSIGNIHFGLCTLSLSVSVKLIRNFSWSL